MNEEEKDFMSRFKKKFGKMLRKTYVNEEES